MLIRRQIPCQDLSGGDQPPEEGPPMTERHPTESIEGLEGLFEKRPFPPAAFVAREKWVFCNSILRAQGARLPIVNVPDNGMAKPFVRPYS